jgi:DNA polymerase-3 subunit chi
MGAVYFYHLTRSTPDAVLPALIDRALDQGWRVCLRGRDPAAMEWLDAKLWLGPEEGFLPHGLAGGPHDADQPVLLTCDRVIANAAACLIAVGGAEVAPDEAAALARTCILFDGADAAAVEAARGQWRGLTAAGLAAQYWSEEDGRWQKKADRPAGTGAR